jgi:trigger factor
MQITETSAEGLKREFKVVVAAADIEQKVTSRLKELSQTVRMPGFRPGKVPMSMLKKRFGQHVMGEVLEQAVGDSSAQAMRERGLRPALQPKVEIVSFQEGADLEYKLNVELLPDITPAPLGEIELERLKPDIPEEEVQKALSRVAEGNRKSNPVERPAESGDAVVIDFVGRIGGTEFPGGKAENHTLKLGSNQFIAGFEDQLVGARAGDERTVKVTFPAQYGNDELAGKDAEFEVKVREVRAFDEAKIDEAFAESIGFDSLDELKKTVREQLERDYGSLARQKVKRRLLDVLAERHDFGVPPGMVDIEFEQIWKQFEEERKRNPDAAAAEAAGKSDDELKEEYRKIAERRVRLGLLLSEIGRQNNIQVTNEEVNRALATEARRFPGQEKKVVDFYRQHPEQLANLRAPIFEDKVIDFILEMAKVTDRPVPPEELLKPDPDEEKAA